MSQDTERSDSASFNEPAVSHYAAGEWADLVPPVENEGEEVQDQDEGVVPGDEGEDTDPAPEGEGEEGTGDEPATSDPEDSDASTPGDEPVVASPEATAEPFKFTAFGKEVEVPGSRVEGDNIVLTKEAWQRTVLPRIADREAWQTERNQYQQQHAALTEEVTLYREGKHPDVARAQAITQRFMDLLDKGPDAVYDWLQEFEANRPRLEAEAERAAVQAERQRFELEKAQGDRSREAQELPQMFDQALGGLADQALQVEEYGHLTRDQILSVLGPVRDSLFFKADRDVPEAGIKRGDWAVNVERADQLLGAVARNIPKPAPKATEQAEARNAAVLNRQPGVQQAPANSPPPVAARRDGVNKEPIEVPKITSKEEWDKLMARHAAGRE